MTVFGPEYDMGFGAFMFSWDVPMKSRKQARKSDGGEGCRRVGSCCGEERVLNISCSGQRAGHAVGSGVSVPALFPCSVCMAISSHLMRGLG